MYSVLLVLPDTTLPPTFTVGPFSRRGVKDKAEPAIALLLLARKTLLPWLFCERFCDERVPFFSGPPISLTLSVPFSIVYLILAYLTNTSKKSSAIVCIAGANLSIVTPSLIVLSNINKATCGCKSIFIG